MMRRMSWSSLQSTCLTQIKTRRRRRRMTRGKSTIYMSTCLTQLKTRRRRRMSWGSSTIYMSTCPTQLKVDRGGRLVDKKHPTGLRCKASWWRTSWLTWWWRWNSLLLQSSWKNIHQSQHSIDLWISLHDSDSGWVGPDKGPFNRRRTLLCRSGAAVVNARANGVLQILSQPMSMEVVTGQRSKRCCTLHADVLNFCMIL